MTARATFAEGDVRAALHEGSRFSADSSGAAALRHERLVMTSRCDKMSQE